MDAAVRTLSLRALDHLAREAQRTYCHARRRTGRVRDAAAIAVSKYEGARGTHDARILSVKSRRAIAQWRWYRQREYEARYRLHLIVGELRARREAIQASRKRSRSLFREPIITKVLARHDTPYKLTLVDSRQQRRA
jgi:hypothetical protein